MDIHYSIYKVPKKKKREISSSPLEVAFEEYLIKVRKHNLDLGRKER